MEIQEKVKKLGTGPGPEREGPSRKRPASTGESFDAARLADTPWHALSPAKVLKKLETRVNGLTEDEVIVRRRQLGPHRLFGERGDPGLITFLLSQLRDPLVAILLLAGLFSIALGAYPEAAFIIGILLFNVASGCLQVHRGAADRRIPMALEETRSRVRRAGIEREVGITELVPGDIVSLQVGERVPADIRLLESRGLMVDDSLLSGLTVPLNKRSDARLDAALEYSAHCTMLHAGSRVTRGSALGVVCITGSDTQVGKLMQPLLTGRDPEPPLMRNLRRLSPTFAAVLIGALVLLVDGQLLRGIEPGEIFSFALALVVSAIPAGLPVAVTLALSVAGKRMAHRHVVAKDLAAVEGLASCSLFAVDKTGILTTDKPVVKCLALPTCALVEVEGEGFSPDGRLLCAGLELNAREQRAARRLAASAMLCTDGVLQHSEGDVVEANGHTVDLAFLVLGQKLGMSRTRLLEKHVEEGRILGNPKSRVTMTFNRYKGRLWAHVKGAPGAILPLCGEVDQPAVEYALDKLANSGHRVVAVASGEVAEAVDDPDALYGLEFLGVAGIIDPLREGVQEALASCHAAGISVRMLTEENPATALSTAWELDIASEFDQVMTPCILRDIAGNFDTKISGFPVFARVTPGEKREIVQALQQEGQVVAVTGNGISDTAALCSANLGVVVGKSGSEVPRRVADMVLGDDNFASIVNGIEEARVAFFNVRKITWLLLSIATAELVLLFLVFAANLPLPLAPIQLLWLNLVIAGIHGLSLAFEQRQPESRQQLANAPDQPVFGRQMIEQTVIAGGYMGVVGFILFNWSYAVWDLGIVESRNILLLLMVLMVMVHSFNCRSEGRSLLTLSWSRNPPLILTSMAALGLHALYMYLPPVSGLLQTAPLSPSIWLTLLLIALSLLVVVECFKSLRESMQMMMTDKRSTRRHLYQWRR